MTDEAPPIPSDTANELVSEWWIRTQTMHSTKLLQCKILTNSISVKVSQKQFLWIMQALGITTAITQRKVQLCHRVYMCIIIR